MVEDLNPQLEQMADESMVRNLAAQAVAIWPQEREPQVLEFWDDMIACIRNPRGYARVASSRRPREEAVVGRMLRTWATSNFS